MASSGVNHYSQPCIYGQSSSTDGKSRFLKWLSKLFKGGGSSSRGVAGGRYPQFLGDENMVWRAPPRSLDDHFGAKKENEELDHAVALSLSDDSRRPNGYRRRKSTDEALARALQDSLNTSSYPPCAPAQVSPRGYRSCAGCNGELGHGHYLACMGTYFHPECFCCRSCGNRITEHEFSLSGRAAYHKSCFKEMTHPKCEVCQQFIPANEAGLIEYRCHPFWSQKYCPVHEHDYTARCCSCERLEPLYNAIRDYYEGLYMKLDQQIPMLLVERQALNEAIVGEKNGHIHMPETRGLCLSEEQTVTSVHKRPRIGGSRLVGMRTQPHKLIRRCEVTAILVLYGLPRLLTGAILAHELMHGWLRLKGYRNLNPEVEEGICQVLSHMWLESEVTPRFTYTASSSSASSSSSVPSYKKGGKSEVENKLGEFFLHQIANDVSAAYGGGFRAAHAAVSKYGLRVTLDHIRLTGSFPL